MARELSGYGTTSTLSNPPGTTCRAVFVRCLRETSRSLYSLAEGAPLKSHEHTGANVEHNDLHKDAAAGSGSSNGSLTGIFASPPGTTGWFP
jgi:hypothetical protein